MREEYRAVQEAGAEVVAISADSLETHGRFCEAIGGCPFPLASDEGLHVARLYDVLGEDGKRSRRAVFVLDAEGRIVHKIPWYQPGNVGQFLEVFQALGVV
ncbi:MAG: redoxin domain-containing protein [Chloroflexi bacterium]|nr:redoxin domain-containing protein [Chloroflexota bacterium]